MINRFSWYNIYYWDIRHGLQQLIVCICVGWVWNCWKQSGIIIFTWQAFAGFHTEAASSGHWGNVSLTKYYIGTYLGGTVVGLHVDKERGVLGSGHVYLP